MKAAVEIITQISRKDIYISTSVSLIFHWFFLFYSFEVKSTIPPRFIHPRCQSPRLASLPSCHQNPGLLCDSPKKDGKVSLMKELKLQYAILEQIWFKKVIFRKRPLYRDSSTWNRVTWNLILFLCVLLCSPVLLTASEGFHLPEGKQGPLPSCSLWEGRLSITRETPTKRSN